MNRERSWWIQVFRNISEIIPRKEKSSPPQMSTSEQDQLFLQKYGRLPPKKAALGQRLKGGDRKYFDSGDYAMSKAGKSDSADVGSQHPSPERIPHSIPQILKKNDLTNSPVKESGLTKEDESTSQEQNKKE